MSVAVQRDSELVAGVRTIAHDVAAVHADEIDRSSRFPTETTDALRELRALSSAVPARFGGKQAPTVSYGSYADDLLTTLRRCETAEPGDQVMVLTSAEQAELQQTGTWDVLGTRGRARRGTSCARRSPADRCCPRRRSRASRPSRWCRSRTSSGRTCGSGSRRTRSAARRDTMSAPLMIANERIHDTNAGLLLIAKEV